MQSQLNLHVIEEVMVREDVAASTTLANILLEQKSIEHLKEVLGFNYFYEGKVVHGRGEGKKLGFPTANIDVYENLKPISEGIYLSIFTVDGKKYNSITSISTNPTFDGKELKYETHILDFDRDIYGKHAYVELLSFMRLPIKFSNIEELVSQMKIDLKKAKKYFKDRDNLVK